MGHSWNKISHFQDNIFMWQCSKCGHKAWTEDLDGPKSDAPVYPVFIIDDRWCLSCEESIINQVLSE